jgi:hypothetical protein
MQNWPLERLSRWLFGTALGALVVGLMTTTIGASCNTPGAWISVASLAPASLACITLLIVAVKERSAESVVVFVLGVAGTGLAIFVAFWWTMLLCRAV